jgi:hemoglobin
MPETLRSRRAEAIASIVDKTKIDENMIRTLVHAFYERVHADPLIGPIFEARVEDWDAHLARMCAFWSSVALMSGRYHGRPMEKHAPLPIDASHFDRWLSLFGETAEEICPPAAAEHFKTHAANIARSLEMGIAGFDGRMLKTGERFHRADAKNTHKGVPS